ncbi:hypothetical protein [Arboricoccus pini]|uniref:hypothetical protein n=1 Tax=Arboricoccus pini TaxID=1963835 RepID=UPI001055BF27|nr:hypothetical protein [Arboricoccus pini]
MNEEHLPHQGADKVIDGRAALCLGRSERARIILARLQGTCPVAAAVAGEPPLNRAAGRTARPAFYVTDGSHDLHGLALADREAVGAPGGFLKAW